MILIYFEKKKKMTARNKNAALIFVLKILRIHLTLKFENDLSNESFRLK